MRADVERQAKLLARENRKAEPQITGIYWFPDEKEVRLVEVLPTIPVSGLTMQPFFFKPAPDDNLPAPSGIALIRPEELRHIQLPANWGNWDSAIELPEEA